MKLRQWLETNGKTQEAFAADMGMTQGRVSQIVRNGTENIRTALLIQRLTDGEVTLRELLSDPKPKKDDASGVAA